MNDCELPQYYTCAEPVARKEHRCEECSVPIEKGERYLNVNGCWDGTPARFKQHLLCAEACMLIRDSGMNDDECISFGGLYGFWEDMRHEVWSMRFREARRRLWRLMLKIKRRERLHEVNPPPRTKEKGK